jgi:divinyl protochlorophyllide a 8-vinyl-reductase
MSATDRPAPEPSPPVSDPARGARVGPNAILQLIPPLREQAGEVGLRSVFEAAGLTDYLRAPPGEMVREGEVRRLFDALLGELPAEADELLWQAGQGTAAYVMANRIPAPVRSLLRILPAGPSARLLLGAIEKNAWTFAGSGRCRTRPGRPAIIEIEANPIATPGCPWHRGVFAGLFVNLVTPRVEVTHPACVAAGERQCRYVMDW